MGIVKNLCFILLLFVPLLKIMAADTTINLLAQKTIPGSYTNFYTDNLNNIYLVSTDNQVKKLDDKYDSAGVFNDVRRYGDIYSMDVSNPLKIIVFYKDFTTILVLDRFFNTLNTIDLRKYGILQVKAVAQSYDNNYWIFDELDNKIKKLDDNGNVLLETADFRVLFSEQYEPTRIIDNDGSLYLYDTNNGWLIFDYYGALKQRVQVNGWKNVQVADKNLFGHDDRFLYFSNPRALNIQQVKTNINLASVIKMQKLGNKFFVLTKDGLSIYTLQ